MVYPGLTLLQIAAAAAPEITGPGLWLPSNKASAIRPKSAAASVVPTAAGVRQRAGFGHCQVIVPAATQAPECPAGNAIAAWMVLGAQQKLFGVAAATPYGQSPVLPFGSVGNTAVSAFGVGSGQVPG